MNDQSCGRFVGQGRGPGTEQPMPTGFSYEEATAICESAVGTIKSLVNSARTRLWVVGQPIKAD